MIFIGNLKTHGNDNEHRSARIQIIRNKVITIKTALTDSIVHVSRGPVRRARTW